MAPEGDAVRGGGRSRRVSRRRRPWGEYLPGGHDESQLGVSGVGGVVDGRRLPARHVPAVVVRGVGVARARKLERAAHDRDGAVCIIIDA